MKREWRYNIEYKSNSEHEKKYKWVMTSGENTGNRRQGFKECDWHNTVIVLLTCLQGVNLQAIVRSNWGGGDSGGGRKERMREEGRARKAWEETEKEEDWIGGREEEGRKGGKTNNGSRNGFDQRMLTKDMVAWFTL